MEADARAICFGWIGKNEKIEDAQTRTHKRYQTPGKKKKSVEKII